VTDVGVRCSCADDDQIAARANLNLADISTRCQHLFPSRLSPLIFL